VTTSVKISDYVGYVGYVSSLSHYYFSISQLVTERPMIVVVRVRRNIQGERHPSLDSCSCHVQLQERSRVCYESRARQGQAAQAGRASKCGSVPPDF
jgi:hypothetical protein